jgi:hypothetical protein
MNRSLRACVHCGVAFLGTERARYCSATCHHRAYDASHREQRRASARQRYLQQARSPRPAPPPRPCAQCGQVFTPRISRGWYCSGACRSRAFQQRHRA